MSTLLLHAPPSDARTVRVGTVIGGRYRVIGELGKGGFGAVFAARHTGTGREVAVKVLTTSDDDDFVALKRFFQEARVTAGLSHANTIRVFDFGQDDGGRLYLAMERLYGVTLKQEMRNRQDRRQVFEIPEIVEIAQAILRSLAEAHQVGLVHRDLKPENVFLHQTPGNEMTVKILDFGIAKTLGASLTMGAAVMGTPAYMSPEQAQHLELDARSDLYSLGVLLFQLLTGDVPFRGDVPLQVLFMHAQAPLPDIRQRAGRPLPDSIVAVTKRALAKDPNKRYQSAREMRDALLGLGSQALPLPAEDEDVTVANTVATTVATTAAAPPIPPPPGRPPPPPPRASLPAQAQPRLVVVADPERQGSDEPRRRPPRADVEVTGRGGEVLPAAPRGADPRLMWIFAVIVGLLALMVVALVFAPKKASKAPAAAVAAPEAAPPAVPTAAAAPPQATPTPPASPPAAAPPLAAPAPPADPAPAAPPAVPVAPPPAAPAPALAAEPPEDAPAAPRHHGGRSHAAPRAAPHAAPRAKPVRAAPSAPAEPPPAPREKHNVDVPM